MEEEVNDLLNQVITQQNEIINGTEGETEQLEQNAQGTNQTEGITQEGQLNTNEVVNDQYDSIENSFNKMFDTVGDIVADYENDTIITTQGVDTDSFFDNFGSAFGSFFGVTLAFTIIFVIISIGLGVMYIIGLWKTLQKVNKPGWLSLIPVANTYVLNEEIGVNNLWLLITLYGSVVSIVPIIGLIVYLALLVYYVIIKNVSLARAFGKSNGFAVGLILLAPIFYFLLRNCDFVGKNPMEDKIFGKKEKSNQVVA